MVGWKRWFYDLAGWEYDMADEKQRRQKFLMTEQIKRSNHRLTLKDREEKKRPSTTANAVVEADFVRPSTPFPTLRSITDGCVEDFLFEMKEKSYAEVLSQPKKRRRKRTPSNINF